MTDSRSDATVPCVVVPREPTKEMLAAAAVASDNIMSAGTVEDYALIYYRAMLAAAPSTPERGSE